MTSSGMKDHSCEYPYILNDGKPCLSRAYQTHSGCGAWLCPEHLRNHDCERVKSWLVGGASLNAAPWLDPGRPGAKLDEVAGLVDGEMKEFAKKDETNVLFDIADFATMAEGWDLMGHELDVMPAFVVGQMEVSTVYDILVHKLDFEDLISDETEMLEPRQMLAFMVTYFSQLRASEYVSSGEGHGPM